MGKCELLLMLTLTCKRAAALLSASLERAPSLRERLSLRLHLRLCAACARYKSQLRLLRRVLRERARRIEGQADADVPALSPDARTRLKRSLQGGVGGRPGRGRRRREELNGGRL